MTTKPAQTFRGAYPCWTKDEDDRLLSICSRAPIKGIEAWQKVVDEFPGRTLVAVRQRYLVLRNLAAGIVRVRTRPAKPKGRQIRSPFKPIAMPPAPPPVEYKTLTAAFFRDPPPGRSALDKRNAGIGDDLPPSNHCEVYYASRPKITLATEPLR